MPVLVIVIVPCTEMGLKYYGFLDSSLDCLSCCLTDRSQFVEYDNTSSRRLKITCGVPQGSILGLYCSIIYMNDHSPLAYLLQ